jgi:predicted permease
MSFTRDVRYAARLLGRQPRYALLSILTIAVGIAATTTLFSVTYGVLMKPLPWPTAQRVVVLRETRGGNVPRFGAFTNATYVAWRDQAATVQELAAWSQQNVTLTGEGEAERIRITAATASLSRVLGVRLLIGSFFDRRDEGSRVAVISERLWRRKFASDAAVLGRPIHFDGEAYTIVGVLPDALAYPDHQMAAIVPLAVRPPAGNMLSMFNVVGLLAPGTTPSQAAAEGTARGGFAADTGMTTMAIFGSNGPVAVAAQPLHEALTADVRRPLMLLLAAVALLLVTAIGNVASLQLARTTTRYREIAIRAALGAGGGHVTRQLFVESLLMGVLGGVGGVGLSAVLHRALPSVLPADFPRLDDLRLDAVVLLFATAVSIGASLLCGLLPALRARRLNLVDALAEDGAAPVGVQGRSRVARVRMLIMVGQVTVACMLLIGASLVGRSFVAMLDADRGYDVSGVLSARLSMPATMYPAAEWRFAIASQILERLSALPGATDAAFTSELPLTAGGSSGAFSLRSRDGGAITVQASPRIVSPMYFSALRITTISGRVFSDLDNETSQPVVVVNNTFARRYLGDTPLGAKVPFAYGVPDRPLAEGTVIGVVDDARYVGRLEPSQPEVFYSYRQLEGRLPVQTVTLLLRGSGDPSGRAAALQTAVREADDRLVADVTMPLYQRLLTTLARPRLYAVLLGGFAAFALIVAAVGLFGLFSYAVSLRARELAVRSALGARRIDLLWMVLRQGLWVASIGVTIGTAAAASSARLVSSELYGIAPRDPLTFTAVPLALLFVALIACVVPATRAANLDPMRTLRG